MRGIGREDLKNLLTKGIEAYIQHFNPRYVYRMIVCRAQRVSQRNERDRDRRCEESAEGRYRTIHSTFQSSLCILYDCVQGTVSEPTK